MLSDLNVVLLHGAWAEVLVGAISYLCYKMRVIKEIVITIKIKEPVSTEL